MKNLTPALIAKAKAVESAEELLEIAKANGVELTAEEVKTYFEQLNATGAVSDDELCGVAGGACGNDEEDAEETDPLMKHGTRVKVIDGTVCSKCKCPNGSIAWRGNGAGCLRTVKCEICGTIILDDSQFSASKVMLA